MSPCGGFESVATTTPPPRSSSRTSPTAQAYAPRESGSLHPITASAPDIAPTPEPGEDRPRLSAQLENWVESDADKTVGGLVELFGPKSFAVLFILLLAIAALPLPTGGVTHVLEVIALLLALQLVVGRKEVWLPQRWRNLTIAGEDQKRGITKLLGLIRRLERISRPRLTYIFGGRVSDTVFGILVIGGVAGAFLAPPFSGLDTLPALGVVLLSLGVLLEDVAIALVGVVVGAAGVVLEIALASVIVRLLGRLF
jgi:hypothetical protein